jgi:hypothetical protein
MYVADLIMIIQIVLDLKNVQVFQDFTSRNFVRDMIPEYVSGLCVSCRVGLRLIAPI